MERRPRTEGDCGQVGIGTLIVFIAVVPVAAIAAGVLVNTVGSSSPIQRRPASSSPTGCR